MRGSKLEGLLQGLPDSGNARIRRSNSLNDAGGKQAEGRNAVYLLIPGNGLTRVGAA